MISEIHYPVFITLQQGTNIETFLSLSSTGMTFVSSTWKCQYSYLSVTKSNLLDVALLVVHEDSSTVGQVLIADSQVYTYPLDLNRPQSSRKNGKLEMQTSNVLSKVWVFLLERLSLHSRCVAARPHLIFQKSYFC